MEQSEIIKIKSKITKLLQKEKAEPELIGKLDISHKIKLLVRKLTTNLGKDGAIAILHDLQKEVRNK